MQTKLTFNKIDFSKNYHMVKPEGERKGNYTALKEIQEKWEFSKTKDLSGCGNICHQTYFSKEKQTFEFLEDNLFLNENYFDLANLLNSPLLLYRLICIFFAAPTIMDAYKLIWEYPIKHKKTGKEMFFGEWKGATNFWLPEPTHKELNEEFKNDLLELLNFLVSDQIPHPYDGCTAGQIA